jgi:hypothetical protein
MNPVIRLSDFRRRSRPVFFTRYELNQLLSLYSARVSAGDWRDYAIDQVSGMAVFSVFRSTHDRPLYSVAKCAPGSHRQGDFVVFAGLSKIKHGHSLAEVLGAFEPFLRLVSG